MSLVSNMFVLFVVLSLFIYYIVPQKYQWTVLLIFSYLYYITGGVQYLLFIIFSTLVTWVTALQVEKLEGEKTSTRKAVVIIGMLLNLGMLAFVKYLPAMIDGWKMLLPLGISFYTFQSTGYLLDVYWKRVNAEKNLLRYALFVSYFPQLLQGPIGRYQPLAEQLYQEHPFSISVIGNGLQRVIWGFAKKMILSDWAAVFADAIWGDLEHFNGLGFFGILFYGIQLYADFSGGMDVVIGISEMFGIRLQENFKRPYFATSMADFWKRWHMTLGEWMMNYVFYPISLSKWMMNFSKWCRRVFGRKTGRVIPIALADVIVFLLVGIWHGASMKYVVYGLINGGLIAFSELMMNPYRIWKQKLHICGDEGWYHIFVIIRTFIIVNLRWFFDRSDTVHQAVVMIRQSLTHFTPSQLLEIPAGRGGVAFVPYALLIIGVGCIVMVTVGYFQEKGVRIRETLSRLPLPATIGIYLVLLVCIGVFGCTAAPRGFIYAQF